MQEDFLGIKIVRTSNAIRRMTFNESVRSGDMDNQPTGTQEMFLVYMSMLDGRQDILQKNIETWFHIRRSTATEILKRMEQKGLIERMPASHDKRAKKIILTDKARKLHAENWNRILATEEKLVRNFSAEEIHTFLRLIEKLQNNIE